MDNDDPTHGEWLVVKRKSRKNGGAQNKKGNAQLEDQSLAKGKEDNIGTKFTWLLLGAPNKIAGAPSN